MVQEGLSYGADVRLAFGYASPNWFLLANALLNAFYLDRTELSQIDYRFGKVNITYGFRLDKLLDFKRKP